MSDKPILFSAPMVRALLEGRKTQTRRIAKVRKGLKLQELIDHGERREGGIIHVTREMLAEPRYAPGDRLWVKETWRPQDVGGPCYRADFDGASDGWKPSISMPRWASRLTLLVTDVRVQRLQDISEKDAIAEGIHQVRPPNKDGWRHFGVHESDEGRPTAAKAFATLWDSINGPDAWAQNPWVVAVSFNVQRGNIDA
jgi:hypothetical protein